MQISRREVAYLFQFGGVQNRDAALSARGHANSIQIVHDPVYGYSAEPNRIAQLQLGERKDVTRSRRQGAPLDA